MPTCFVIMPYGGKDEGKRKHYLGVFKSIIEPAAAQVGYQVKRSDIGGEAGNITQEIIRDLAEADVVIADLTEGNANVYFELGIRHVLRKSGTVHIVDASHDILFDVRQYRAVEYSTDLADLPGVIDQIALAIQRRASEPNRSDNPVHDALPGLPFDFRETSDAALRRQLEQLEQELDQTRTDKESLESEFSRLSPSGVAVGVSVTDLDIDAILDAADKIRASTGADVLLGLSRAMEEGGTDGFIQALRNVLKSPYLDLNDFIGITNMCRELGLDDHRRATLEVATRRHPGSDEMRIALADAYDDSPNPQIQQRGRSIVESYLQVEQTANGPIMNAQPPMASEALGLLFNGYFKIGKPEWVISLAESAEKRLGADSLIVRNGARALALAGRKDDAEAEFKRALQLDPKDDGAHLFYSSFLDSEGRYDESLCEHETAVFLDAADGASWVNLAIQVLNRGLFRDESGAIVGPVSQKERVRVAVPLLVRALEDRFKSVMLRGEIVKVLVRADAVAEAQIISEGALPESVDDRYIRELEKRIHSSDAD